MWLQLYVEVDVPYRAPGVSTGLGFVNGIPVRHEGIMNFSQSRETPVNQNKTGFNIHNISKNVRILKCYLLSFFRFILRSYWIIGLIVKTWSL